MMPAVVGVYPTAQTINGLIAGVMARLNEAVHHRASLADRHNAYTDYCLGLLFTSTGHRPVIDPFQSLNQFDLDRGLLLVSDKVNTEERAWHLVALPPVALKQVNHYRAYLPRLAAWLARDQDGRSLANDVLKLEADGPSDLPLFFYLDEKPGMWRNVTPAEVAKRWAAEWILPLNFLRHVMATELLHQCGRADWVQIQLGHIDGQDHPLGKTTAQSAVSILAEISMHLEAALGELGWRSLPAALRMPSSPVILSGPEAGRITRELGHERRWQARERGRQRVGTYVRKALQEALNGRALNVLTRDELTVMLNGLVRTARQNGIPPNRSLRLMYRFLRTFSGGSDQVRRLPRIRYIEPEPSPFFADSFINYKRLHAVRAAFVKYLDLRGRGSVAPTSAERIAEIVISAALFSGLADRKRLLSLHEALPTKVYRLDRQVFVDIALTTAESAPVFRWFPDPISAELIMGLFAGASFEAISKRPSLEAACRRIFGRMDPACPRSLAELVYLAKVGPAFETPGYVCAILNGTIPAVSLPLEPFVRVVTGRSLSALDSVVNEREKPMPPVWAPAIRSDTRPRKPEEAKQFLAVLTKTLSKCFEIPAVGNQRPSGVRKRRLSQELRDMFSGANQWSSLPLLIVAWAMHLCHRGTRLKRDLAYSTIVKYLPMVAKPLLSLGRDVEFLMLDDHAFEDLYLRALNFVPSSQRAYLASRIQEFHDFLVNRYEIEEPDWSAVMAYAGADAPKRFASANFVTQEEYLQVMEWIQKDKELPELKRTQYAVLLLFGYRFGLRFGEAWRLQYRDVQYDSVSAQVYLLVRNTVFGEVKTEAGLRVVPLLETLDGLETEVLEKLLNFAQLRFEEDPLLPLMTEPGDVRQLIVRDSAVMYIHTLLRYVSGDLSLRFHHLRHGWATRMVCFSYFKEENGTHSRMTQAFLPKKLALDQMDEFLGPGPIRHPLRSISTAIGHVSEVTTLGSYTHSADQVAGDLNAELAFHHRRGALGWSDYSEAYCLQVAHATIRRRRGRNKTEECLLTSQNRRAIQGIPEPPVQTVSRPTDALGGKSWAGTRLLRPANLEELLRRFGETIADIHGLSSRLLIDPVLGQRVLDQAVSIERESGFVGYRLEGRVDDPIMSIARPRDSGKRLYTKETERLQEVLLNLEPRLMRFTAQETERLAAGLGVWRRTFHANKNVNLLTDLPELRILLAAIKLLQMNDGVVLRVDRATNASSELRQALSSLGCPVVNAKIPKATEKTEVRRLGRIEMNFRQARFDIGPARSFHRLLFVLSVWVSVIAMPSDLKTEVFFR